MILDIAVIVAKVIVGLYVVMALIGLLGVIAQHRRSPMTTPVLILALLMGSLGWPSFVVFAFKKDL